MNEIIRIMGYMAPLTTALFCLALLAAYRFTTAHISREDKGLLSIIAVYYVVMTVNWLQPLLYIYYPEVYAQESAVYFIGLLLTQAVFYHIIYKITAVEGQKPFPFIHYALIGVAGTLFAIWSLLIPYDVRLTLTNTGEMQAGYGAYSMLSVYKLELRGIYTVIYGFLCIRRLLRYRKIILEYSVDRGRRSSPTWLYSLIIFTLVLAPLPMIAFFIPNRTLAISLLPMCWEIPYMALFVVLLYNLLAENYVIIRPEKQEGKKGRKQRKLSKTDFETYMSQKKPYLNSKLRITDLTLLQGTNRTYLSGFINKEYGMNFSRYINLKRLEELNRLRTDAGYNDLSEVELALKAGFSSYYGYRYFLRAEERLNRKPFVGQDAEPARPRGDINTN
ncbi:MAG: hypothetical protein LBL58_16715 [Tannerellaceae bacterium]|jgi:AraC-like DNA-binding protein|nr:hypothetical protein [Tannerellaceae bacterium]